MKKSKIITGLSAGFMAAIALSSCSLVKSKSGVVLTINGVDYKAEDLFKDQKSAAAGEAKFNAVYKVAVRQYFTSDAQKDVLKQIQQDARNKVSGQKDLASSNASKNGTSYDTEWNKILSSNKVDDEQGLYDKFEYDLEKEKFDDQFYEANLSTLRDGGKLKQGGKESDVEIDGFLKKKHPYHVKHILVKVSAAADDPARGEIKEEEANKLFNVIDSLARGVDFSEVAKQYSDDTGSKTKGGDLGIMDLDTSFVNEFKLGTYMYESYFGKSTSATAEEQKTYKNEIARNKLFGINGQGQPTSTIASDYADKVSTIKDPSTSYVTGTGATAEIKYQGIGQIPFEAALALGTNNYTLGGTTKRGFGGVKFSDKLGSVLPASDDKAAYYPRNVIFNKFFNKNNIMVITPRLLNFSEGINVKSDDTKLKAKYQKITGDATTYVVKNPDQNIEGAETADKYVNSYSGVSDDATTEKIDRSIYTGFKIDANAKNKDSLIPTLNTGKTNEILRDENGRTIFVFRSGTTGDSSYQGIHFVCIERSPFIGNEIETRKIGTTTYTADQPVTREEYYTYYSTTQDDHPKYRNSTVPELNNTNKLTYVSSINSPDPSTVQTRVNDVKSKFKTYDSNLNTYIYKYLISTGGIKFASTTEAQNIETDIKKWIDLKIEDTNYTTETKWNETWETYYNKLNESSLVRFQHKNGSKYVGGIVSEACAIAYAYADKLNNEEITKLFGTGGAFHD